MIKKLINFFTFKPQYSMAMDIEFRSQIMGAHIQFQRGPRLGQITSIINVAEEAGSEYIYFEDGTKELSVLFHDKFIIIDPLAPPMMVAENPNIIPGEDDALQALRMEQNLVRVEPVDSRLVPMPTAAKIEEVHEKSALQILLDKQKRTTKLVKLSLTLEIPEPASMKILKTSFDDFDQEFLTWIKNDPQILEIIMTELKTKLIN